MKVWNSRAFWKYCFTAPIAVPLIMYIFFPDCSAHPDVWACRGDNMVLYSFCLILFANIGLYAFWWSREPSPINRLDPEDNEAISWHKQADKNTEPELLTMGGGRFIFSDLTAQDKETGLIWTRDANIAGRDMDWSNANDFVTQFDSQLNRQRYAGYNDWRLPTIEEIQVLVDYPKSQGYRTNLYELFNKIGFKNVQPSNYWSATSIAYNTNCASIVNMRYGDMSTGNKSGYRSYVWPVRSGQ